MTLEDIAKMSGGSRSAIYRVINDYPNVRFHTREQVLNINHQARIGFADVDAATQDISMLTPVRHPLQDKGSASAELLINLVKYRVESLRQSCGANRLH